MVFKVNVTISPADLTDLYVIDDDLSLRTVKRLSDFEVSGNVLTGLIEASQTTDTIKIISSGYVEQVLTFSDIQTNPDIVLVSSNEVENLSDGTNTYPIADKTSRELISSLDDCAFNGIYIDQTYDSTSTNAQSGTAVAEAVSDRANTDLSNLTSTGKSYGSGLGLPSSTYDNLTLGASGSTYTAPANGWIMCRRTSTAVGQELQITNNNGSASQFFVQSGKASGVVGICLPVKKGDVFAVAYTLGSSTNQIFRFIYAEGENV